MPPSIRMQRSILVQPETALVVPFDEQTIREISRAMRRSRGDLLKTRLVREVGRVLAQTNPKHKLNPDGSPRTVTSQRVGQRIGEVSGARVQTEVFVDTEETLRRAIQASGDYGEETMFTLVAGSRGKTRDKRLYTLDILEMGTKGHGPIWKRVSFWGRYGNEGRVTREPGIRGHSSGGAKAGERIPSVTHVGVRGREFMSRVVTGDMLSQMQDAFASAVAENLNRRRRKYLYKMQVKIDIAPEGMNR